MPVIKFILVHEQDFDTYRLTYPAVFVRGRESVRTEMMVITDEKALDMVLLMQKSHKLRCRQIAYPVKTEELHGCVVLQKSNALLEGCEQLGTVPHSEHFAGMFLKSDDHRLQATFFPLLLQMREEKTMPEMNTIKKSYGCYTVVHFTHGGTVRP